MLSRAGDVGSGLWDCSLVRRVVPAVTGAGVAGTWAGAGVIGVEAGAWAGRARTSSRGFPMFTLSSRV